MYVYIWHVCGICISLTCLLCMLYNKQKWWGKTKKKQTNKAHDIHVMLLNYRAQQKTWKCVSLWDPRVLTPPFFTRFLFFVLPKIQSVKLKHPCTAIFSSWVAVRRLALKLLTLQGPGPDKLLFVLSKLVGAKCPPAMLVRLCRLRLKPGTKVLKKKSGNAGLKRQIVLVKTRGSAWPLKQPKLVLTNTDHQHATFGTLFRPANGLTRPLVFNFISFQP